MDNDKLDLLDDQIAMLDALASAVANNSPAAIEGYRASLVARRRELCGEDTELAVPDEPGDDPSLAVREPGSELVASDLAAAAANPRMAEREDEHAADVEHLDEPGEQLVASDQAAQDANPHEVDSRGNVGHDREALSEDESADQAASIKPYDDNEVATGQHAVELAKERVDAEKADEDSDQA